jgi:trehalose synthase
VKEIEIQELDPGRFDGVLEPEPARRFAHRLAQAADRLAGRHVWHVNSTEKGGGVAEMLHFLLGYLAGAGIDTRWGVIEGNEEFFQVTKRLHYLLHGQPGDARDLDEPARASFRQTLKEALGELQQRVEPGDVVVLHDPQTAGLVPALKQQGAVVIWSCHVGVDSPTTWPERHGSSCGPLSKGRLRTQEPADGAAHGERRLAGRRDSRRSYGGSPSAGVPPPGRQPGPSGRPGGDDPG